jgi:hypothetical protein
LGLSVPDHAAPHAILPLPGGVQLEWRGRLADLEVDIGPDGQLGYLLVHRTADGRASEEAEDVSRSPILACIGRVLAA